MKRAVVGIGAGGHAKVVIEILRMNPAYELVGLLDPKIELHGQSVPGVPILGDDAYLSVLYSQGVQHFFVGLGGTGNVLPRQKLFEMACRQGMVAVDAIHPQAIVSPSVSFGPGVTICAGAIIGTDAKLGSNVMVNTAAVVEHDCQIGDHVHIATGVKLASTVQIDAGAHVGVGATIRQCIHVGHWAIVGAGAVVVKDVQAGTVVVGVPAKELTKQITVVNNSSK